MVDLGPAARRTACLVAGIGDAQLAAPTPCSEFTLGELLRHVGEMATTFTAAARKRRDASPVREGDDDTASAKALRERVRADVLGLALAWRTPTAWTGETTAAGTRLDSATAGLIALDELVVHGWDIARASGQGFDCDPHSVRFATSFFTRLPEPLRHGRFGPPVDPPAHATELERLIALTGRDPVWAPTVT